MSTLYSVMLSPAANRRFNVFPSGNIYFSQSNFLITNVLPQDVSPLQVQGCQLLTPRALTTASRAPLSTDDFTANFGVGSVWVNIVTAPVTVYACTAMGTTANSAVWTQLLSGTSSQVGIVNIRDFGAVGNGIVDDSAAVINAANSLGTAGGLIICPTGKYGIGANSIPLNTNLIYSGYGIGATEFIGLAGSTVDIFQSVNFSSLTGTNTAAGPYKFGLRNMTIDANKAGRGAGRCCAIYGFDYEITRVQMQNSPTDNFYSEWCISGTVPVGSTSDSMEAHITQLKSCFAVRDGIVFNGPHDTLTSDVLTFVNGRYGLNADNSTLHTANGLLLNNFHSYGNTSHGVVANCVVYVSNAQSESNGGDGFVFTGTPFGNVGGSGLTAFNNGGNGFSTSLGTYLNLSAVGTFNNTNSGGAIGTAANISGWLSYSNHTQGVFINANEVVIDGLRSENNLGNGVDLVGSLGDIVISGKLSGNLVQMNFGTGLSSNSQVNVVVFNTAGGQTSYQGTYSATAFVSVMTGGTGALTPIFSHP